MSSARESRELEVHFMSARVPAEKRKTEVGPDERHMRRKDEHDTGVGEKNIPFA
jgi:hypothetical protein